MRPPRAVLVAACALAAVVAALAPAPRAAAQLGPQNAVDVVNNRYEPQDIRIQPGQRVTWRFQAPGHTVTSDTGLFNFDPGGTVPQGQTREFLFTQEGIYGYYCRVHGFAGNGMWGRVLVGDVNVPTPEPTPPPPPPEVRKVPSEYPSITAALPGASNGTIIEVAPGYSQGEGDILLRTGITVRGMGEGPEEVVVNAGGRNYGFRINAPGARVENLSIRNSRTAGVLIDRTERFALSRLNLQGNLTNGVSVFRSSNGRITDVQVSGSGEAGVSVRNCRDCNVVVEGVTAEGNTAGYWGVNAGGVSILRSTFRGNGSGVVLSTAASDLAAAAAAGDEEVGAGGTHVWGNTIEANNGAPVTPRGRAESLGIPAGVGVWVAGARLSVVEDNVVREHDRYGVAVSLREVPTLGARVLRNHLEDSGGADLAWDGVGANVCFSGNNSGEGEPSSDPPAIQELYPCSSPATVGLPQPLVTLELALAAAGAAP